MRWPFLPFCHLPPPPAPAARAAVSRLLAVGFGVLHSSIPPRSSAPSHLLAALLSRSQTPCSWSTSSKVLFGLWCFSVAAVLADRECSALADLLCVHSLAYAHDPSQISQSQSLSLRFCIRYLGEQAAFHRLRSRVRHFGGVFTLPYKITGRVAVLLCILLSPTDTRLSPQPCAGGSRVQLPGGAGSTHACTGRL